MALPKQLRLKGHRAFKYIYKNSNKYYGKFMDLRIAKSCPKILLTHKNIAFTNNFKLAISVSKKFSKRSVVRNRIRRILQDDFLRNFKKEYNHIPYWVLVNLKGGNSFNDEGQLLKEFHYLIIKTGLLK